MSVNWNYAKLSKEAKNAGGPEKFVETIELSPRQQGSEDMLPVVTIAFVSGSFLHLLLQKYGKFICQKRKNVKSKLL